MNRRMKNNSTKENLNFSYEDRIALHRMITGALRDTINAHGPLGPPDIGSASKRIVGAVISNFTLRRIKPKTEPPRNNRKMTLAN